MKRVTVKKPDFSRPSKFFVKTKSPRAYKRDEANASNIRKNLEHYTEDWLAGRISDENYKKVRKDLNNQLDRLVSSNYMKTYSITMTDYEFKLFSEFLEQKNMSKKSLKVNEKIAQKIEQGFHDYHSKTLHNPKASNVDKLKAADYESQRSYPFEPDGFDIWMESEDYARRKYENATGRNLKYDHKKKNYVYTDDRGKTVEISPEDKAVLKTWELELRNKAYQQDEKFKNKTQFRKNLHDAALLYRAKKNK